MMTNSVRKQTAQDFLVSLQLRNAWAGQFSGKEGCPTVVLEAVADQDLWVWHANFGTPGVHNDISVLRASNLFDPGHEFRSFDINGNRYDRG